MDYQGNALEGKPENRGLGQVHLPPPRQPLQQLGLNGQDDWMMKVYPSPEIPPPPQQLMTPQTAERRQPDNNKPVEPMAELVDDGRKPPYSYAMLIGMAIMRSPNQRLTLSQIYQWINDSFAHYRQSSNGWQNSIRHNLSLSKAFVKQHRPKNDPGKGNYWVIAPGFESQFIKPLKRSRGASELAPAPSQPAKRIASMEHVQKAGRLSPPPLHHPMQTTFGTSDGSAHMHHAEANAEAHGEAQPEAHLHAYTDAHTDAHAAHDHDHALHRPIKRSPVQSHQPQMSLMPPSQPQMLLPPKKLMTEMPTLQPPPTIWMPQVNHVAPVVWDEASPLRSSPSHSLDAHRRLITQLCTPSIELSESPIKEELQLLLPSPHQMPDARRRLFCDQQSQHLPLSHQLAPPPYEGEHVRDMYPTRGHDNPVFTPVRRPFDTPIRDQSYVFSPAKTPLNNGSPRRGQ